MRKISGEEALKLAETFPLKPRFNKIIVTLNNVEQDSKLQLSETTLSEPQYIVAIGPMVNGLELGDRVLIDVEKMMVPVRKDTGDEINTVMQVKVDPVQVGQNTFAFLEDRLIKAIDNREEKTIKVE